MKRFKWVAALVMAGCLLMMPEVALNAAREAMASWASSVAPALFPFMALMPLLTCDDAARAYEALLGRIVRPLFRLPGAAAPAVLTGMAAGSPAGAMAAVRVASASVLRRGQLERLVICIGGLSPAFLVSGIGAGMLGSAADGWVLLRAQLGAQLVLLLATRGMRADGPSVPDCGIDAAAGIGSAVGGVLGVCGYMMLFNIIGAMLSAWTGGAAGTALLCLLDLPSGAQAVAKLGLAREIRLPLLAAISGFGGLCIAAQNLSACMRAGVRPSRYFAGRIAGAGLAAGFAALQIHLPEVRMEAPAALPVAALAVCALAIPVCIQAIRNFLLTKENAQKELLMEAEKGEKAQDIVDERERANDIM